MDENCSADCNTNSSGTGLVLFGTAAALELSKTLTLEQMNVLAALFMAIGDQLALLAAAEEACLKFCTDKAENAKPTSENEKPTPENSGGNSADSGKSTSENSAENGKSTSENSAENGKSTSETVRINK